MSEQNENVREEVDGAQRGRPGRRTLGFGPITRTPVLPRVCVGDIGGITERTK